MKRQRVKLSLHIRHPARNLSTVCSDLGFKPAYIWKKGDERLTPKGNRIGGIREASYCSIDFGSTSREHLAKLIEAKLELLKPHQATLRRISTTGGTISFYVGWFCDENTGETFNVQLLREMAGLRIALELNIYVKNGSD
jgi:hypothetical protein